MEDDLEILGLTAAEIATLDLIRNVSERYNCTVEPSWTWDLRQVPYPGQPPPSALADLLPGDWALVAVFLALSIVGVAGNVGVVVAVCRERRFNARFRYYVMSLAGGDIFIGLLCSWLYAVVTVVGSQWVLGPVLCTLSGFVLNTALTSSSMTLAVIAVERMIAVLRPMSVVSRSSASIKGCRRLMMAVWIASAMISAPIAVFRRQVTVQWKNYEENLCVDAWPSAGVFFNREFQRCFHSMFWKKLYFALLYAAMYWIPSISMWSSYAVIVKQIWQHGNQGSIGNPNENDARQLAIRNRVMMTAGAVLLVFFVGWTPLQLVNVYSTWVHDSDTDGELPVWFQNVSLVSNVLLYSNAAIHPLLYGRVSSLIILGNFPEFCNCVFFRRSRNNVDDDGNDSPAASPSPTSAGQELANARTCRASFYSAAVVSVEVRVSQDASLPEGVKVERETQV